MSSGYVQPKKLQKIANIFSRYNTKIANETENSKTKNGKLWKNSLFHLKNILMKGGTTIEGHSLGIF